VRQNGYQNYLEAQVMSADPIQLVQILYRAALDSIRTARECLRKGDIAGRSRSITKALSILSELATSLDHEHGGEISGNLARLYDYVQRLLMDANFRQIDEPIAEAENLLSTLLEAWCACGTKVNSESEKNTRRHETDLTFDLNEDFAVETGSPARVCYAG